MKLQELCYGTVIQPGEVKLQNININYYFFRNSWMPIVNYINDQYEAYLKDESGLNRRNISDNRVHCCLYFVNAAGHG